MGISGDNADEFAENMDGMANSAGAAEAAFEIMEKGFTQQMKKLKAGFQSIVIQIGAKLIPKVQPLVEWLGKKLPAAFATVSEWVTFRLIPAFQSIKDWVGDRLLPVIQPLADWFGKKLPQAFATVWEWMRDRLGPVFATVWEWLEAKLPAAFATVSQVITDQLIPALKTIKDWLGDRLGPVFAAAWGWLQEKIPLALATVSQFITDKVIPALGTLRDWLGEKLGPVFATVWEWLQEKIPAAFATVTAFITDQLIPAFVTVKDWLGEKLGPAFEGIQGWFGEKIPAAFGAVTKFINDKLVPAFITVKDWLGEKIPLALAVVTKFIDDKLVPAFITIKDWLGEKIPPVLETIRKWFQEKIPAALGAISTWVEDNDEDITGFFADVKTVAEELWLSLQAGVVVVLEWLTSFALWFVDNKPAIIIAIAAIGVAIVLALGPVSQAVLAITGIIVLIGFLSRWIEDNKEDIIGFFAGIIPVADELWESFKVGITDVVLPLLTSFAQWLIDNKVAMIAVIAAIGVAIFIALGPVSQAAIAITGIITLIGYLKKNWDDLKRSMAVPLKATIGGSRVFEDLGGVRQGLAAAETVTEHPLFDRVLGRAHGGPVAAGVGYMVGERGPERFIPNVAGKIMPHGAGAGEGMGGGMVVNVSLTVHGNLLAQRDMEDAVVEGVIEARRRGRI